MVMARASTVSWIKKRVFSALSVITIALIPSIVWAHGDIEELGHHWEIPAYIAEVRYQVACMALMFVAISAVMWITRLRKRRSARQ